jgi:guanylate cyclase, other
VVADSLKAGMPARPELFPEASVFFSIINKFDELLVEMTPVEISDLLDRLWLLFDEIIERHDVYKVCQKVPSNCIYTAVTKIFISFLIVVSC